MDMSGCASSYNGMVYVFFSISSVLHSNYPTTSNETLLIMASDVQQHSLCSSGPAFILLIYSLRHIQQDRETQLGVSSRYPWWGNQSRACGLLPTESLHIFLLGSFWHFNFMGMREEKESTWDSLPSRQNSSTAPHHLTYKKGWHLRIERTAYCLTDSTLTLPTATLARISTCMGRKWIISVLLVRQWLWGKRCHPEPKYTGRPFPHWGFKVQPSLQSTYTAVSSQPASC